MEKNKEYDYEGGLNFADFYSSKNALQKFLYNLKIFFTNDKEAQHMVKSYNASRTIKESLAKDQAKQNIKIAKAKEKQNKKDAKEAKKAQKTARKNIIKLNKDIKNEDEKIPVPDKVKKPKKEKIERSYRRAKPRAPHSFLLTILDFVRNKIPNFFAKLFTPTVKYTEVENELHSEPKPENKVYKKRGGGLLSNDIEQAKIFENIHNTAFINENDLDIVDLYEQKAEGAPKEDIMAFAVGAMITGVVRMDTNAISSAIKYATGYECEYNEKEDRFELSYTADGDTIIATIDANGEIAVLTDNPQEDGQNVALDIELAISRDLGYIAEKIPHLMIDEKISSENFSIIKDYIDERQVSQPWGDIVAKAEDALQGYPEHMYSINRAFAIMKTFYPDTQPSVLMEYGFAKPMQSIQKMPLPIDYKVVSGMQILYGNAMSIKDAYTLANLFVVEGEQTASVMAADKREVVTADIVSKLKLNYSVDEIAQTVSLYSNRETAFEMKVLAHYSNALLDEGKTMEEVKAIVDEISCAKEAIVEGLQFAVDNIDKTDFETTSPLKSAVLMLSPQELHEIASTMPAEKQQQFYDMCKQWTEENDNKDNVGDAVLSSRNNDELSEFGVSEVDTDTMGGTVL